VLNVTIDDKRVQALLTKFPQRMGPNLKRGFVKFGAAVVRTVTRESLGVPDDRVPIPALGGLGVRPASSRGLVRRTGSLARGLIFKTEDGQNGNTEPSIRIGFLTPRIARYARVHELGTVGKGGRLPDIYGRPYLRIPLRVNKAGSTVGAAVGAERSGFVLLRKVSIPPRLHFFATVNTMISQGSLKGFVKEAIDLTLKQIRSTG